MFSCFMVTVSESLILFSLSVCVMYVFVLACVSHERWMITEDCFVADYYSTEDKLFVCSIKSFDSLCAAVVFLSSYNSV